ncbi:MAG: hypothetical protein AAGF12_36560, partial [Myxococcota bacterium]
QGDRGRRSGSVGREIDAHLLELDAESVRLARVNHRTRLQFGEVLAAIGRGYRELGYSSFGAYVQESFGALGVGGVRLG